MTSSVPPLRLVVSAPATDGALCRAFLDGDRQAFGELIGRYQETVFKLVRRYATSSDEARDLTQRAFLQALEAARRSLPRLARHQGDVPFKAWLLRIAINLGKNSRRDGARWQRASMTALELVPAPTTGAHAALELDEQKARVATAVVGLPKRQREVFTLRIDAGLPFAEIARTLGISEGNAKSHFHHAVKRLQRELHEEGAPHAL